MKTTRILAAAFALMLTLVAVSVMAQGPSGPPGPPSSTTGPVDSGVVVLLAAATLYGYRKIKADNKAEVQQ